MYKYTVNVQFVFEGKVEVMAESKSEAREIVKDSFGTVLNDLQSTSDKIVNWNFDIHPDKKVL